MASYASDTERFELFCREGRYERAIDVLFDNEDRATRGYSMATVALASSATNGGRYVGVSRAMNELLEAHETGDLQPPLSEDLVARLGVYVEVDANWPKRHQWSTFGELGAVLLTQVINHGQNQPTTQPVGSV